MFRHNRHSLSFRSTVWLSLLAALLPTFVMLTHRPATVSLANMLAKHCHVSIASADAQSSYGGSAPQKPANKLPPCPICQTLHAFNNGFLAPQNVVIAAASLKTCCGLNSEVPQISTASLRRNSWPRAPPSFA